MTGYCEYSNESSVFVRCRVCLTCRGTSSHSRTPLSDGENDLFREAKYFNAGRQVVKRCAAVTVPFT
jgi:hypothetical protein